MGHASSQSPRGEKTIMIETEAAVLSTDEIVKYLLFHNRWLLSTEKIIVCNIIIVIQQTLTTTFL